MAVLKAKGRINLYVVRKATIAGEQVNPYRWVPEIGVISTDWTFAISNSPTNWSKKIVGDNESLK